MTDVRYILYDRPADHVARITLDRPQKRNAQNTDLLYELNAAFDRAVDDSTVRVIVLAANGPDFSAGHDLSETDHIAHLRAHRLVGIGGGFDGIGAEGIMAYEREVYLGLCERWRNLPKPTIAQVQGRCIAGGMMLVWPCDLIVASDDAVFIDNTLELGVAGCEYFAHPWELGPRQAKEWLFTSDGLSAADAHRLGMVNRVVPLERLEDEVLELAGKAARKSSLVLRLAKEAVNAAEDGQGRRAAFETAFALHQLAHAHNMQVHGVPVDPAGINPVITR